MLDKSGKASPQARTLTLLIPTGDRGVGQRIFGVGEAGFWFLSPIDPKASAYVLAEPLDHRARLKLTFKELRGGP